MGKREKGVKETRWRETRGEKGRMSKAIQGVGREKNDKER